MATAEGLIQLPVPPGCVRDLRLPGEVGLLVVFADPAAMTGSSVCRCACR
jgi:hypothetical protein